MYDREARIAEMDRQRKEQEGSSGVFVQDGEIYFAPGFHAGLPLDPIEKMMRIDDRLVTVSGQGGTKYCFGDYEARKPLRKRSGLPGYMSAAQRDPSPADSPTS
jgi:hypothetical protein